METLSRVSMAAHKNDPTRAQERKVRRSSEASVPTRNFIFARPSHWKRIVTAAINVMRCQVFRHVHRLASTALSSLEPPTVVYPPHLDHRDLCLATPQDVTAHYIHSVRVPNAGAVQCVQPFKSGQILIFSSVFTFGNLDKQASRVCQQHAFLVSAGRRPLSHRPVVARVQ